jgi:serine/threonine protein phosphatase PrpC
MSKLVISGDLTNSTDSTDSKVLTDVSNLSVKISGRSDIGGQKYNQDAYWIYNNLSYGIYVIGVLDGHDKDTGKIVADTAKNFAESFTLTNIELAKSNPIKFLELIFEGTQCIIKDTLCNLWREKFFEIKEESGFILKKRSDYTSWEIIRGGATKSMCMIVGNKMYIANVGDSSGILYSSLPVLKKSFIKYEKDVEQE